LEVGSPILKNVLEGYNGCIIAYGQSGSGKTYTMMGSISYNPSNICETSCGLIPRLCQSLFEQIQSINTSQSVITKFQIEMSYMEIYAEQIRDLLQNSSTNSKPIKIREHPVTGPFVENLTYIPIESYETMQQMMLNGSQQRKTASTNLNDNSSRAHSMLTLYMKQNQEGTNYVFQNKLCFVDLAGSERVRESGVTGIHFQEATDINKSLTALGRVISILAKQKKEFVPFRDSSLTWMLKDMLGGNSKTVMMATISPSHFHFEETLSTLQYAYRTKQIVNHSIINSIRDKAMISKLRQDLHVLSNKSNTNEKTKVVSSNQNVSSPNLQNDQLVWDHIVEESNEFQKVTFQKQFHIVRDTLQLPFLMMISEPNASQELMYYLKLGTTCASIIDPTYTCKFFHDHETGVWLVPMDESMTIFVNDENIEDAPRQLSHGDRVTINNLMLKFKIPICAIK
jgi:hypothetical protein